LKTFDTLTLSYEYQKVKVVKNGKTWEFQGVQSGDMEMVQVELMDKTMYQAAKGWIIYVCNKEEVSTTGENKISPLLQALCEEYIDIFSEVSGLPLKRAHDHQIPLVEGAHLSI